MPVDYKEYPENWFTEIRPAVLARDGNKCAFCGAPNHALVYREQNNPGKWHLWPEGMQGEALLLDGYKAVKIVLTVAHLDHDHNNHAVELDKLRALCQRCHLKHDIKHHVENRKYGRNWKKQQYKLNFQSDGIE
jgi:5-methylcytosine-specific restriction endonuclease McrA